MINVDVNSQLRDSTFRPFVQRVSIYFFTYSFFFYLLGICMQFYENYYIHLCMYK